MNILVTGASGFIGRAWIERLRDLAKQHSYNIFALSRKRPKDFDMTGLRDFYERDITVPFRLPKTFHAVFHFAACNFTHVGQLSLDNYHKVNVVGTEHLIQSADIDHFIFLSTTKVYQGKEQTVDESGLIDPAGQYEKSKLNAELVCRKYLPDQRLTILRAVNVVGPGQAEKAVLPVFFQNALQGKPLEIFGSSRTRVQLLYIDDLLDALELLLKKKEGLGVVNLTSDEVVTLRDLAEKIIQLCRSNSSLSAKNQEEFPFCKMTSSRTEEMLGWKPRIGIQDILQKYHQFLSEKHLQGSG